MSTLNKLLNDPQAVAEDESFMLSADESKMAAALAQFYVNIRETKAPTRSKLIWMAWQLLDKKHQETLINHPGENFVALIAIALTQDEPTGENPLRRILGL